MVDKVDLQRRDDKLRGKIVPLCDAWTLHADESMFEVQVVASPITLIEYGPVFPHALPVSLILELTVVVTSEDGLVDSEKCSFHEREFDQLGEDEARWFVWARLRESHVRAKEKLTECHAGAS